MIEGIISSFKLIVSHSSLPEVRSYERPVTSLSLFTLTLRELFSGGGSHDEGIDLADLAPPERDLDFVFRAHDGCIT